MLELQQQPQFFFLKSPRILKKVRKTAFRQVRINSLVVVIKMDFFGMQINQVHLIEAFITRVDFFCQLMNESPMCGLFYTRLLSSECFFCQVTKKVQRGDFLCARM